MVWRWHWTCWAPPRAWALPASGANFGLALVLTQHEVGDVDGRVRTATTMLTAGAIALFAVGLQGGFHWPQAPAEDARSPGVVRGVSLHLVFFENTFNQKAALRRMIDWVTARSKLSRQQAFMLMSLAADVHATQLVKEYKGIHVMLPKSALEVPAADSMAGSPVSHMAP